MPSDWDSEDAAGIRAEALDVLSDALQWQLAETRWPAIEQVLAAMDAAVTGRDLHALMAATADLELAGPLRITRIGATPILPAPPKIRDRLNQLVFTLGGVPAASDEDPGPPASGYGRGGAHGQPHLGR
jgi:CATRA-Associated Small Protein